MADTTQNQQFQWTTLGGNLLFSGGFPMTTSTPVLCKDGKYDYESNSPNARYDHSKTCINNGGRAENNIIYTPEPVRNVQAPTKSRDSIFKKLAGAYNKNLIIAVVLVAGYFAYKKFKK